MGHKKRSTVRRSAHSLASGQRNISVSEFFVKNRHLLGFDSPQRALLTAVKEAVDNSLDACEEAGLLPEVWIEIDKQSPTRYLAAIEDNGPGIVDSQIARIFGKLLYGSKFHELSQSRGQQGLGISAAGLYAQLTTGKPMRVISRTSRRELARELYVSIDTNRNRPDIHAQGAVEWRRSHGTRVELELEGQYQHGQHSIATYLRLTAIANPHVSLHLREPDGTELSWERTSRRRPPQPRKVKPHPHGVELGQLIAMLKSSPSKRLGPFLQQEFSQIGARRARLIIDEAGQGLTERSSPRRIARAKAEALHRAIAATAIPVLASDCVVPIGEAELCSGLHNEVPARFVTALTRHAAVYRGNPFVVEVAIAYGGNDQDEQTGSSTPARLLRFANRVPLLYQQSHCAMTLAATHTNWRRYGLEQSRGSLPRGPLTLVIHLASVWVPFTSESKEAIAAYDEIVHEIELALCEAGRRLSVYLRQQQRTNQDLRRRNEIAKYVPYIGEALSSLLDWPAEKRQLAIDRLEDIIRKDGRQA